jgi:hypothetical protein
VFAQRNILEVANFGHCYTCPDNYEYDDDVDIDDPKACAFGG